eukprot:2754072-Karenia_brevis.AAC.1
MHEDSLAEMEQYQQAWDDISGEPLNPKQVVEARLQEIAYIKRMGVWIMMRRRDAIDKNIKIIGTKWLDVNKGDKDNPNLRSRLVGQEFRDGENSGLFASTPPLEALRLLVSDVATVDNQ